MAEPEVKRLSHFSFSFFFGAVYNFYWEKQDTLHKSACKLESHTAEYAAGWGTSCSLQDDEAVNMLLV